MKPAGFGNHAELEAENVSLRVGALGRIVDLQRNGGGMTDLYQSALAYSSQWLEIIKQGHLPQESWESVQEAFFAEG